MSNWAFENCNGGPEGDCGCYPDESPANYNACGNCDECYIGSDSSGLDGNECDCGCLAYDACRICYGSCDVCDCGCNVTHDACGGCDGAPDCTGTCGGICNRCDDYGTCCDGQIGCDGVCDSGKVNDYCGWCGGSGQNDCDCGYGLVYGCDNVCNSGAVYDYCGACGGSGQNDCDCAGFGYDSYGTCCYYGTIGCDGNCNSGLVYDYCGACGGSGQNDCDCGYGPVYGCDNICDSGKVYDYCGACGGSGQNDCDCVYGPVYGCDNICDSGKVNDCAGNCDGNDTYQYDDCGNYCCSNALENINDCNTCAGYSCTQDCAGSCNGSASYVYDYFENYCCSNTIVTDTLGNNLCSGFGPYCTDVTACGEDTSGCFYQACNGDCTHRTPTLYPNCIKSSLLHTYKLGILPIPSNNAALKNKLLAETINFPLILQARASVSYKDGLYGKRYDLYFPFNGGANAFGTLARSTGTNSVHGDEEATVDFNHFTSSDIQPGVGYEYYSWQWLGYFKAPYTDTFTFSLASDDYSQMWIGELAVSGFNDTNKFTYQFNSNSVSLIGGQYYPIRIQFGEFSGADYITLSYSSSTESNVTNFQGKFYHKTQQDFIA